MLEVRGIQTFYGRSHILHGVSLEVKPKDVVCLLGRNGVGKTTTLKSIMGLAAPREGSIVFEGQEISRMATCDIARKGISFVPEDRRIFPMLSVEENLILGTKNAPGIGSAEKKSNLEKVYYYFPVLKQRWKQLGGTLSGGEQQMLTLARGLMGSPRLMLLDEPFEGLAPLIIRELMKTIRLLCANEGLTLLLVEQNARLAIRMSDRGYVLEKGMITFEGSREVMLESDEVSKRCGV